MKTKQASLKAVFSKECNKAINHGRKAETIDWFVLIDKKTEKQVVVARAYMGRGRSASQVKASIWVDLSDKKKPADWKYGRTSGSGQAGGYGYDKASTAIADAIESAGIELYDTAYLRHGEKVDFKNRVYFGGVGLTATRSALLAIAYAAGWTDVVFVEA